MSHSKAGMPYTGMPETTRAINLLGADYSGQIHSTVDGNSSIKLLDSIKLQTIHDDLLAGFNLGYDSPTVLPAKWQESSFSRVIRKRIAKFLGKEFLNSGAFVVKDSTTFRVLPLWIEAFQVSGIEPVVILPIRHPYEVSALLEKRNAILSNRGVLLWLFHLFEAEFSSRKYHRSFILFNELIDDWRKSFEHLSSLSLFGSQWPVHSAEADEAISEFLAPDLKHHDAKTEDKTNIKNGEELFQLAEVAYHNLKILVDNPSNDLAQNTLDEVRRKLLSADKLYASFVTNRMDEAALDKYIFGLGDTIRWLNKQRDSFETTLTKTQSQIEQMLELKQDNEIEILKCEIIKNDGERRLLQLRNRELEMINSELSLSLNEKT